MGHVVEDIAAAELVYAAALETRAGTAGRAVGSAGAQGTRHRPARGLLDPRPAPQAHDSLAPPGASHNWLPEEEWVGRHWIPFDEQALKAELGLEGRDLHAYLYNDHRTLAALTDDPQALADRLVAPWQGISDAHRAMLRERTLRILTQGHLAQHMFFHVFHGAALHTASNELLGMDAASYRHHREEQLSYVEIARRGGDLGRAAQDGHAGPLRRSTAATGSSGSRRGRRRPIASSPAAARGSTAGSRRPPPGDDPANPYGKNRFLHGVHAVGWPATAAQRRADDLRVDRFRRALPKSCWPVPPRWSP